MVHNNEVNWGWLNVSNQKTLILSRLKIINSKLTLTQQMKIGSTSVNSFNRLIVINSFLKNLSN